MKKLFLMVWILSSFVYADLSVDEIQNMVLKIHQKREGIKLETLDSTKEPFVRVEEEKVIKLAVIAAKKKMNEAKMTLHAILNNKAYINNSWMREKDEIMGYTLAYIGKRGVVLRNDNHIKKLFLKKERNTVIQVEERY